MARGANDELHAWNRDTEHEAGECISANKRIDTLNRAAEAINGERQQSYGNPEDNFGRIASMWSSYLGIDIKRKDVAAMMILVKIARVSSNQYKDDNWVDIAGYAACGNEVECCDDNITRGSYK